MDDYIYLRSRERNGKVYCDCRRTKSKGNARALTIKRANDEEIELVGGPDELKHSHPPTREGNAVEKVTVNLTGAPETAACAIALE